MDNNEELRQKLNEILKQYGRGDVLKNIGGTSGGSSANDGEVSHKTFGRVGAIGMDFGTSTSLIAYRDNIDNTIKLPNYARLGGKFANGLPSLFWSDGINEAACDEVITDNYLENDPENVCRSVKMKLDKGDIILGGESYKPAEIIIKQVRRLWDVNELIQSPLDPYPAKLGVGVPVVFRGAKRGEYETIMREAMGGKTQIVFVEEPTAAACWYDEQNVIVAKSNGKTYTPGDTMALDVGGGTSDVSILEPTPNEKFPYKVRFHDGIAVAGDAMDQKMEEIAYKKIVASPGSVNLKLLADENHFVRRTLKIIAKEMKERLSLRPSVRKNFMTQKYGSTEIEVTLEEYENAVRPVIKQIVDMAENTLKKYIAEKGVGKPQIRIILVGGGSYTPLLRKMLKERFPWLSDSIELSDPETAVARGAALYAERKVLIPRVNYGYLVDTYLSDCVTQKLEVIIPSNADLPKTVTTYYKPLKDDQKAVTFRVYEIAHTEAGKKYYEIEEGINTQRKITHFFDQPVTVNTSIRLDTTLDENGVLTMTVSDAQTKKTTTEKFTLANTNDGKRAN